MTESKRATGMALEEAVHWFWVGRKELRGLVGSPGSSGVVCVAIICLCSILGNKRGHWQKTAVGGWRNCERRDFWLWEARAPGSKDNVTKLSSG